MDLSIMYMGELAALGTAVTWSACALLFTSASRRMGSFTMSHYRMLFGLIILLIAQFITKGVVFPAGMSLTALMLLGGSGLFGFFLTDALLFQSYIDISPRLGILIFSSYPFASALIAWLVLGETLAAPAIIGMAVTIAGIAWVVLEKNPARLHFHREHLVRGMLLASGAVVFQAISFALAKPAMTGVGGTDALTATIIRAIFGGAAFWVVSLIRGRVGIILDRGRDMRALAIIGAGALVGPSLGVWLSMVAIKLAPIGIASTLMALMPVTILPMTAIVYRERISLRALIGAAIACLGVAILFNG